MVGNIGKMTGVTLYDGFLLNVSSTYRLTSSWTYSLYRQTLNVQASTKVTHLPVCFYCLVTLRQRLWFVSTILALYKLACMYVWRVLTVILTCRPYVLSPSADSYDFGLLRKQSSPKWEIPCPGRPWTTVQNLTPLALSSPEKSVTVQTNTQTNKNTNSNRYIHTLPIGKCG